MNKKGGLLNIVLILVFLIAILIWGLHGSEKIKAEDIECKLGWKTSLCWSWENSTTELKGIANNTTNKVTGMVVKYAPVVKDKVKEVITE